MRALLEQRWPIGSTPRAIYAIALYFGHRRSDVARVKWADLEDGGTTITQWRRRRGGVRKTIWFPIHEDLAEVLDATPRRGDYVILTRDGQPFSVKALGMRMKEWT